MHQGSSITHTWLVRPTEGQKLIKRCPNCGVRRRFLASGLFRVNAQKKLIDVWHIYRCEHCDYTWNIDIVTRTNRNQIDPDLYNLFLENDPEEARRRTFDYDLLRRNNVELAEPPATEVIGPEIDEMDAVGWVRIKLTCEFRLPIRLANILRVKLGLSKRRLEALVAAGRLTGISSHAVSKPVSGNITFELDVAAALAARAEHRASQPEAGQDAD